MPGMRYQPQGRILLNRAVPQLAGTVAIVGNVDARNGRRPSPTSVITQHGRASGFSFTGNLNVPYASLDIPATPSWTVLMVIRKDANDQYSYFLGTSGGTAANTALAAAQGNVGRRLAVYDGSGTVRDSGLLLEVGRFYVAALSFDNAAGEFSWFVDGAHRVTTPGAGIGGSSWQICGTTNLPTNVTLPLLAIVPRALPAGLMRALTANPWQMFEDENDVDFAAQSLAQHVLPVGGTVLAIAGGQVGMRVSRRLRAEPASLALGPRAVALRAARRMSVQPASLTILAGPTRMSVSRRFGVKPAALAMAGQGAALRAGRRMRIDPAVLGLDGGQVGMQYAPAPLPGSYTLPVSAAAMTLGGSSVGMRVTHRMSVAAAQLRLVTGDIGMHLQRAPGSIDMSWVSLSRIVRFESSGSRLVMFEGSGSRVVVFEGSGKRVRFNQMSAKVPTKIGEKWTVDRDRDEISYHAADITDELADRNTTAVEESVVALVYGVELLEGPEIQTAQVDGVERTFVVVKLGGVESEPGASWRWVARVECANGERFDKTTWFNEVDP